LTAPGPWRERLVEMRYNASSKSHAELDEATELDVGDPDLPATAHERLKPAAAADVNPGRLLRHRRTNAI